MHSSILVVATGPSPSRFDTTPNTSSLCIGAPGSDVVEEAFALLQSRLALCCHFQVTAHCMHGVLRGVLGQNITITPSKQARHGGLHTRKSGSAASQPEQYCTAKCYEPSAIHRQFRTIILSQNMPAVEAQNLAHVVDRVRCCIVLGLSLAWTCEKNEKSGPASGRDWREAATTQHECSWKCRSVTRRLGSRRTSLPHASSRPCTQDGLWQGAPGRTPS